MLGGEFNSNTRFPENDHRNYNIKGESFDVGDTFSGINFFKGLNIVEEIKKIIPKNITMSQFALKWVLMHEDVTVVIPGAVNSKQVKTNCTASELDSIDDIMPEIRKIFEQYIKDDVHEKWN